MGGGGGGQSLKTMASQRIDCAWQYYSTHNCLVWLDWPGPMAREYPVPWNITHSDFSWHAICPFLSNLYIMRNSVDISIIADIVVNDISRFQMQL